MRGSRTFRSSVVRLCEVAQGAAFRRALEQTSGYDVQGVGEIRFDADRGLGGRFEG